MINNKQSKVCVLIESYTHRLLLESYVRRLKKYQNGKAKPNEFALYKDTFDAFARFMRRYAVVAKYPFKEFTDSPDLFHITEILNKFKHRQKRYYIWATSFDMSIAKREEKLAKAVFKTIDAYEKEAANEQV